MVPLAISEENLRRQQRHGGATVIVFARDTNKVPSHSKRAYKGSIEVIQGNITQRKDVRRALGRKVDVTVNFAADFSADVSKSRAVNVFGEQHILDASVEFGIKRHIYIRPLRIFSSSFDT